MFINYFKKLYMSKYSKFKLNSFFDYTEAELEPSEGSDDESDPVDQNIQEIDSNQIDEISETTSFLDGIIDPDEGEGGKVEKPVI